MLPLTHAQINMTIVESVPLVDQPDQLFLFLIQPSLHFRDKCSATTSLSTFMQEYIQSIDNATKRASIVYTHCVAKQQIEGTQDIGEANCKDEYPNDSVRVTLDRQQILKRSFSVPSNQKQTLTTHYALEFPSDQQIQFWQK